MRAKRSYRVWGDPAALADFLVDAESSVAAARLYAQQYPTATIVITERTGPDGPGDFEPRGPVLRKASALR